MEQGESAVDPKMSNEGEVPQLSQLAVKQEPNLPEANNSYPNVSSPILSPNFTAEDLSEWTNCALLIPHEPIRSGLKTLVEITNPNRSHYCRLNIDGLEQYRGKQIRVLFQWYNDIFHFYVHHHHDHEESIYFPWLQQRTEKLPEKMTNDHDDLITMLDNIKDLEKIFFYEPGRLMEETFVANLKQLHEACIALRQSMEEHLDEEEMVVPGLLRKYSVTEKEHEAVVDRIIKSSGWKGNKIGLPWIIDCMTQWGGTEMVKEFRSSIPLPVRMIQKKWWTPHYMKNNKEIAMRMID